MFKTADLLDDNEGEPGIQVLSPGFSNYGGNARFSGRMTTIKAYEDNSLVREWVAKPGEGGVLVIDGGGSTRCAMLGDLLAKKAMDNGWAGILVYGMIRDSVEIAEMAIGVKALGTLPLKSIKRGEGQDLLDVRFRNAILRTGEYLYSDEDGIILSPKPLL